MASRPEASERGRQRAAWVAWGAAVVVVLALCARYDSSSTATVREEARLQAKVAESLRRHAAAAAPRARSPKLGGKSGQALYDVPSFTEEHTRMHFPQAEAGWLDMAAAGQIGDDVKTDDEQGNLTAVIDEWTNRAYAEKALARSEAETAARDENYYEYNITKGVATHKFFPVGAPPPAAQRAKGAAPQLKGAAPQLKGAAPQLKGAAPQLAATHGKPSLAYRKPAIAHPQNRELARPRAALPARVRAEERIMERTMEKEVAAEERIKMFRAQMKETMHVAQMKLAHQEMGWKPRKGPAAERDVARTQSLGEMGAGAESDHMTAVKKAEIVNSALDDSLISANEVPHSHTHTHTTRLCTNTNKRLSHRPPCALELELLPTVQGGLKRKPCRRENQDRTGLGTRNVKMQATKKAHSDVLARVQAPADDTIDEVNVAIASQVRRSKVCAERTPCAQGRHLPLTFVASWSCSIHRPARQRVFGSTLYVACSGEGKLTCAAF